MLTRGLFVPFSVARVAAFCRNWPSGGREGGRERASEGGGEGESRAFSKTRPLVAT